MRCLIVEDHEFMREGLKLFLQDQAEIETAVNGKEAVQKFKEALHAGERFHLVLLDIMMPEMDGQQALKLIRQVEQEKNVARGEEAVIIMTTALTSEESMEEALWDGDCTDYLVKPVSRADLMAVLHRYQLL